MTVAFTVFINYTWLVIHLVISSAVVQGLHQHTSSAADFNSFSRQMKTFYSPDYILKFILV